MSHFTIKSKDAFCKTKDREAQYQHNKYDSCFLTSRAAESCLSELLTNWYWNSTLYLLSYLIPLRVDLGPISSSSLENKGFSFFPQTKLINSVCSTLKIFKKKSVLYPVKNKQVQTIFKNKSQIYSFIQKVITSWSRYYRCTLWMFLVTVYYA